MRSSPKRRKVLNRTGIAVLSVVALVGNSPAARSHGSIAGGGDRVHTCVRSLSPRILRIVTPADVCSSFEQGVDFPHNGTLIGVELGPPAPAGGFVLAAPAAKVLLAPIVVACPPTPAPAPPTLLTSATGPAWLYRAVGVTFTHGTDLTLAVSHPTSDTTWEVAFIAATPGLPDKVVSEVRAVCVRLFQQA